MISGEQTPGCKGHWHSTDTHTELTDFGQERGTWHSSFLCPARAAEPCAGRVCFPQRPQKQPPAAIRGGHLSEVTRTAPRFPALSQGQSGTVPSPVHRGILHPQWDPAIRSGIRAWNARPSTCDTGRAVKWPGQTEVSQAQWDSKGHFTTDVNCDLDPWLSPHRAFHELLQS